MSSSTFDLVYHPQISFLHQAPVNPGVFLDVSVGDHFAIGPDHLDLITNDEVDRLSCTRLLSQTIDTKSAKLN